MTAPACAGLETPIILTISKLTDYMMTLETACLMLCIAYRLQGTDSAVIHGCHLVRDRVSPKVRPLINKGMRCRSPSQWVQNIEKEMGW